MSPLTVLMRKEILYTTKLPIYWISTIISCAFFIWIGVTATSSAIDQIAEESPEAAQYMSGLFSQLILVLYPFSSFVFMSLYLFTQMFTSEKTLGQMEALLTTPLRVKQLWLGKCLSMFILIYPFVVSTLLIMIGLWGHQTGNNFLFPSSPVLLIAFIGSPLLAFLVISFLGFVSLLVRQVNVVQSFVFFTGFGTVFGGSYAIRALTNNLKPDTNLITWHIAGSVLLAVIILFLVLWLLRTRLSKDHIVRTIS